MKRSMTVLLALLLIVAVAISGNPRKAEDRNVHDSPVMGAMDASSAWTPISAAGTIRGISIAFDSTVWASGYAGSSTLGMVSSTDRKSWTSFIIAAVDPGATRIAAKNKDVACIGLWTGEILRTSNGGVKWDTVYSFGDKTLYINDIYAMDTSTVIACGDGDANGVLFVKSTDFGLTWTRSTNLPAAEATANGYAQMASYRVAIDVVGNTIWVANYWGSAVAPRIMRSDDRGATWTSWAVTLPGTLSNNYYIRAFAFKDTSVGYAIGRRAYGTTADFDCPLHKTTDGGRTWGDTLSLIPNKPHNTQKLLNVNILRGTNTMIASGYSTTKAMSFITTDDGQTWSELLYPYTGSFYFSASLDINNTWGGASSYLLQKQSGVKVTFLANTAGVPDTLKTNSYVQIRGEVKLGSDVIPILAWGMSSPAKMANAGGDNWKYTLVLPIGATLQYKFFTNAATSLTSATEHQGWEGNLADASTNRVLTVGSNDTTLPLQYVNGFKWGMGQYELPFTTNDSTFVMYVRINMQGWGEGFNPVAHKVGIRGSNTTDWGQTGELGWGSTTILTKENPHVNGGSRQYNADFFYNTAIHVPKKYAGGAAEYKNVIHLLTAPNNEDWGLMVSNPGPQWHVTLPPTGDTTVYWHWYADVPYKPSFGKDTVTVTFRLDMDKAITELGFAHGDTLQVRTGYGQTAKQVDTIGMAREGLFGTKYVGSKQIPGVTKKAILNYQIYRVKNGVEYREIFYDFTYKGSDVTQAERRKVTLDSTSTKLVQDTINSISALHRMPRFRNMTKLSKAVAVKIEVDARPAIYQVHGARDTLKDIQSQYTITPAMTDSIMKWGLYVNGPITGTWASWGGTLKNDTTRKMFDDGTHGDRVVKDSVFARTINLTTNDIIGQEFKFGIGGGDNEGGYGNNHIENINDASSTYTLFNQFGSIDPIFYYGWDYLNKKPTIPLGVEKTEDGIPMSFNLAQNYPNPFNPTTVIEYSIPRNANVTLKIFNMLGQEVMTLVNGEMQNAGVYKATLNASKLSSGVYFYHISAGTFTATKKMVLLK
jgi:hypothetical protein